MSVQTRLFTMSGRALVFALISAGVTPAARADAVSLSLRPAVAPAVPAPPSKVLPSAVDVKTPYQAQVSCDPRPKPGVTAFAALMTAHYRTGATATYRSCLGDVSEHYDDRALDWMNSATDPRQKAVADSVVAWLSAGNGVMARRFGISYIIWNRRMWREYAPERGWAAYTGSVPHTDHVHFSFSWDGAMKRTSWWTGTATSVVDLGPCRVYTGQFAPLYQAIRTAGCPTILGAAPASPYPVAAYGQKSVQIAVAQRALGVAAGGQFDLATFGALVSWQKRMSVPVTGVLDKATWARLVPTKPAPAPPPVPGLKPAPAPEPTPKPGPAPRPLTVTAVVTPPAGTPYTPYKRVVLRQGSKGAAVLVLQRAVKVTPDGAFGPRTRAALVAFQRLQRLPVNGVADALVWDRLERRDYPLLRAR